MTADPDALRRAAEWQDHVQFMDREDAILDGLEQENMSEWTTVDPAEEELGKLVRQIWLDFCAQTKLPPSHSHSAPWAELTLWEKEVDRRIGVALHAAGILAGRQQQREIDAAVCRERAEKFRPLESQNPDWMGFGYDSLVAESEACAAAIEAGPLP